MNKILLIEPYRTWLDKYSDNKHFSIYADKTLHHWGADGTAKISEGISYPSEIDKAIDIDEIRAKIEWAMPIWYRWIGEVENYEIFRRTSLLFIISLAQKLTRLNVKHAIFTTGASHHVEYSLIEIACQIANVRQIYLYAMPFGKDARLLPLIQNQSIRDRELLGLNISAISLKKEIAAYRNNHLLGERPQNNESINIRATSCKFAVLQVAKGLIKEVAKKILRWKVAKKEHFIDQCSDYSYVSLLKIIGKQKEALDYYMSRAVKDDFVGDIIAREAQLPIIFAHYQPEATSFPEGGDLSNHVDIVLEIRRMGYRGTILYKEHPGSWIYHSKITGFSRVGLYRSVEYYKQLEALGCVFLKPSYKLTEQNIRSLLPVTITGSIGIERSLVGLATCCAGEPWFKGAPGIYSVHETFKDGGILVDSKHWYFNSDLAMKWFEANLSQKTINNFYGSGTGVVTSTEADKAEYLMELDNLCACLLSSDADNKLRCQ
ncbi:MAG: hypothetical protein ABII81_09670 [Pseudomonadota bacterium]